MNYQKDQKLIRPEKTGFNMFAEYTQLQLTFLAIITLMSQTMYILNYSPTVMFRGTPCMILKRKNVTLFCPERTYVDPEV